LACSLTMCIGRVSQKRALFYHQAGYPRGVPHSPAHAPYPNQTKKARKKASLKRAREHELNDLRPDPQVQAERKRKKKKKEAEREAIEKKRPPDPLWDTMVQLRGARFP
jgi:hypothetical protein